MMFSLSGYRRWRFRGTESHDIRTRVVGMGMMVVIAMIVIICGIGMGVCHFAVDTPIRLIGFIVFSHFGWSVGNGAEDGGSWTGMMMMVMFGGAVVSSNLFISGRSGSDFGIVMNG